MNRPPIVKEVVAFLRAHNMPAVRLANAAGVTPVTLCRVLSGARNDIASMKADALREAMKRLSANLPTTPEGDA